MAKVCHEIGMCFYVIYNVQKVKLISQILSIYNSRNK